jgi:osmotically-inducible protein OsmY
MKIMQRVAWMAVAIALLTIGVQVQASTKMDDRIEASARDTYVFKTYLKSDDVKVRSVNGVVTLTGTVSEESHKSLAREAVVNLPGVTSVDNRLEVKGGRPAENSDAWLMMKVKASLLFHNSVSGLETEVSDVKDGIVTLRGQAATQAEKDLTTEYAKDVEGVKDVRNEMTVGGAKTSNTVSQNVDDASITAQVKMALLYHRSTSALNTSVTTSEGVVTLGGKAKSVAEKDLATTVVHDVNGVKSVKNLMTIE